MRLTVKQLRSVIREMIESIDEAHDAIKPKYPGSYIGQSVTTNGQTVRKRVSWQDKGTGERRFGGVETMGKVTLIWDGKDWVTPEEFRRGRVLDAGEKESVEDFLKRGGKIKRY